MEEAALSREVPGLAGDNHYLARNGGEEALCL